MEKNSKNTEHIYRVSFKEPPYDFYGEQCDFFFGSLSAIYEQFDRNDIGCSVERLWNLGVSDGNTYNGRRCTITREDVLRKKRRNAPIAAPNLSDNNLPKAKSKAGIQRITIK